MNESAREYLASIDEDIRLADGFDEALIGWSDSWREKSRSPAAVYSVEKCLEILMKDGLSYEDAVEYFEFNIAGAYVGKYTPIFVWPIEQ